MIKYPFSADRNKFAEEFKNRVSGVNVTFEFANLESAMAKVAKDMEAVLGKPTYSKLVDYYATPQADKLGSAEAVDALQRAMLHFTFYHQLIFIVTRISNDGVTVKKNDDETTAFKYQTDELKETLVATAWFWLSILYGILGEHPASFPDWGDSDQNKLLTGMPVNASDFEYWFGVSDSYFVIKAASLVRKVYMDEILPRMDEGFNKPATGDTAEQKKLREDVDRRMRRAIVVKVMALALKRFDYFELPEPVRKDYFNEMGKNHAAQADKLIKESTANVVSVDADRYLRELEQSVQLLKEALNPPAVQPIAKEVPRYPTDKHVFI